MELKRLVFGVQYDGSCWHGWQTQPSGKTVQDALESALSAFAKTRIVTSCAGRTDAGVHAVEQVVHFDTSLSRTMYSWVNGVNAFLPESVVVRWAKEVLFDESDENSQFHARFSAHARTYHYVLYNSPIRSPLWSKRAGWVYRPLDVEVMREAAKSLLGMHDFSAFRAASCQAKSPVKHMYDVQIRQQGELIVLSFSANAFLHHMIRNLVGALIFVGLRKKDPRWIESLLENRDRSLAAPTFMPDGLYLAKINYDKKWDIPQGSIHNFPTFLSFLEQ